MSFLLAFPFMLSFPSSSPDSHIALMGDLPLHLRWGEGNEGSSSWPLGAPQAGETADARKAESTGESGRNGWRRGAHGCCGWAGSSRTELSGAQSNTVDPESTNPPAHLHLLLCI